MGLVEARIKSAAPMTGGSERDALCRLVHIRGQREVGGDQPWHVDQQRGRNRFSG